MKARPSSPSQKPVGASSAPLEPANWLAAIVESSDDAIVGKSLDGIIMSWNGGAEHIFGYAAQEVLGRPITVLIPSELWADEDRFLEQLRSGGRIDHVETTRVRKDGRRIAVSLTISPVFNAQGQVCGISKIVRDVTERNRLIKQEEGARAAALAEHRFQELIEYAPDAILQVDSSGAILIANRTAESLFGYSREELVRLNVDALVPEGIRHKHAADRARFASAGKTRPMGQGLELHALRKDNTLIPVEISLSPISTESGVQVIAVIRDVTERRRTEQQLHTLQQSYMHELEARQQEAERLNRLKSEFMASISHELRTPLHTIIGFGELLGEDHDAPLNDKQRRFLHHIQADSEHLLSLINDVLDLSRIEAGGLRLDTQPLLLAPVITESVHAILPYAAERRLLVATDELHEGISVLADPLRVRQILYNLLSNGVKFTAEGGSVNVSARMDGHFVRITVADTGVGIPEEECLRIFDKFYQTGYTSVGTRQGTGLGLTISKQLVEMQGGTIWVESKPGRGSRFHFTLPVQ
ncbi:MAG TPA: PAS domain-containing sensor histidine kinase [Terriglobales bacterium]|nr:PAS domain-containing sensor histidine kinase [Terriglobales bacterium]